MYNKYDIFELTKGACFMPTIGDRIKAIRKAHRLTQTEFGDLFGIVKSTVSSYETGRSTPDDEIKLAICKHFDLSMDYLLGLTDTTHTSSIRFSGFLFNFDNDSELKTFRRHIEKKGITTVANITNIASERLEKLISGDIRPAVAELSLIAKACNCTVDELLGTDIKDLPTNKTKQNSIVTLDNVNIHMIPLYESVSAGFGVTPSDEVIDFVPCYISSEYDAENTLCIRVCGDSMYPKIENGDIIQVHKQTSVDSGSIAVVFLDGEGLVKKVEHGEGYIILHSINPYYPPMKFEGSDVLRIQVVGLVKKIIKEV